MRTFIRSVLAVTLLAGICAVAHAGPRVLVCEADTNGGGMDLQGKLTAYNVFDKVDYLNCATSTPSLAQLKMYEAVVVFDDINYSDRNTLGTNLADYVDAGGGVLQMMFNMYSGYELGGKWQSNAYSCVNTGQCIYQNSTSTPKPKDATHPIVQGVTGISSQYRGQGGLNAKWGAKSVWDYSDGLPFVCVMSVNGHPRVDLNFYPGKPPQYYTESKPNDGALIVKNALLFLSGGFGPFKPSQTNVMFPDTGSGSISAGAMVTFTNGGMMPATVTSIAIGGANAGDFQIASAPQTPLTIAVGASFNVAVQFAPKSGGARLGVLKIGVQGQTSTQDVNMTGNGIGAKLVVSPSPFNVGGTPSVGTPLVRSIHVSNQGGGKVTVKSAYISGNPQAFSIAGGPNFPVAISPGASFDLPIQFVASQAGKQTGELTVTSNDPASPTIQVPLLGSSGPPAISLDTGSLAFPAVNVGGSFSQFVTVTNAGSSNLSVTALTIGGANPGDFKVDGGTALPGALLPGASAKFTVTFAPTVAASRQGTVTVSSNDPNAGTKVLNLYGTGTTATLTVSKGNLDFGTQPLGKASTEQPLVVSNTGTGTLKVMSLAFSGADAASFVESSGPSSFNVGPSGMQTIGVACKPAKTGNLSATLTLTADAGTATVALTCVGAAPVIVATPAKLDFGDVAQGTPSDPKVLKLSNAGTIDLTITSVVITGANQGDFLSTDLPMGSVVVKPGQSTQVTVTFSPTQHAGEVGAVEVTSTDPITPKLTVALSGNGVTAGLSLSATQIDFGKVSIGQTSAPKPLVLTNTGDGALVITKIDANGGEAPRFSFTPAGPFTIPGGQTMSVMVTFSPSQVGLAQATMLVSPMGLPMQPVSLKGSGVSPTFSVSPMALDFGSVQVGMTSAPQTVTISNTGPGTINLMSVKSSDPAFRVDVSKLAKTLAPAATTTFTVSYAPTAPGDGKATIGISLMGDQSPSVSLPAKGTATEAGSSSGCSVAPSRRGAGGLAALALLGIALAGLASRRARRALLVIAVVASSLAALGGRAEAKYKVIILHGDFGQYFNDVRNKLMATQQFDSVDEFDISQKQLTAGVLMAYDAALVYTFNTLANPAATGDALATMVDANKGVVLAVSANQTNGFSLVPTGQFTKYYLTQNGNLTNNNASLGKVNDMSSPILAGVNKFGCTNGFQCRHLSAPQLVNGATSVADWSDGSVLVARGTINNHLRIDLNMFPPSDAVFKGNWDSTSDGAVLMANALTVAAGGGNPLVASPKSVKFDDTNVGSQSASVPVTFTNNGMMAATVSDATIGGANPNDFVASVMGLPVTVAVGASVTVNVAFSPTNGGARAGTLQVKVNGFMATADVPLTGNGVPPKISVTPSPIQIGGLKLGQMTAPVMVTVANAGGAQLHVKALALTGPDADRFNISGAPDVFPVTLGPTASFSFQVAFTPLKQGFSNANLVVTSDDPNGSTFVVPVVGSAGDPVILLDTGTILFGKQRVGIASAPNEVQILNTGYSDLHVKTVVVGGPNGADFAVTGLPQLPVTIAQGMSAKFQVVFTPGAAGARSGSVTITSDDPQHPSTLLQLSGVGAVASTTIAPNMLDFGKVSGGMKGSQNLTITNQGEGTVTVNTITITGPNADQFTTNPGAPVAIAGNSSSVLQVIYQPTGVGMHTATLTLTTDDPKLPTFAVPLSGTGVSPKVTVTPMKLDFGDVAVGDTSPAQTVTVSNGGTQVLTIKTFDLTGTDMTQFSVLNPIAANTTVAPGASVTFKVSFKPTDNKQYSNASVTLTTDDPNASKVAVMLSGYGRQATLTVSPTTLTFDGALVGGVVGPKKITISNGGDASVHVKSVTATGTGAASFSVDMAGGFEVKPGGTQQVGVTFSPTMVGSIMATLLVTASDQGVMAAEVELNGTGVSTKVDVAPMSLDFGPIVVGNTSKPQSVTVHNGSQGPLTIDHIMSSVPDFVVDDSAIAKKTLAKSDSQTFTVTFKPTSARAQMGSLQVLIMGSGKSAAAVMATGTGVAADAGGGGGGGCAVAATGGSGRPGHEVPIALCLGALAGAAALLRRRRRAA